MLRPARCVVHQQVEAVAAQPLLKLGLDPLALIPIAAAPRQQPQAFGRTPPQGRRRLLVGQARL